MEWGAFCSVVLMEAMCLGQIADASRAPGAQGQKGRNHIPEA